MTQFNAPAYDIQRPTGKCAFTGRTLEPGEPYIATLIELDPNDPALAASTGQPDADTPAAAANKNATGLLFRRLDVSVEAWGQNKRPDRLFSFWRSIVPPPNQKKKMFVDDAVLMDLLLRLADDHQPQRQAFRFVLALILMRKKLLRYDGQEIRDIEIPGTPEIPATAENPARPAVPAQKVEQEWWRMTPKGATEPTLVLNPQLDEQQIQQVTEQLGQVLEVEV